MILQKSNRKHNLRGKRFTAACAAMCCAAALLTSCSGGAPQTQPTDVPPQATDAAAAPEQAPAALRTLLDSTTVYSANSLGVYIPMALPNNAYVATRVDFADGVQRILCTQEGCEHSAAPCTAYIGTVGSGDTMAEATRLLADEQTLFRFQELALHAPAGMEYFIEASDVNGANVRRVCESFPAGSTSGVYLSDGTNLYSTVMQWDDTGVVDSFGLYAADMASGTLRTVCDLTQVEGFDRASPSVWLIGGADGRFVHHALKAGPQLVSMKDSPEEMARHLDEEERAVQHTLFAVDTSGAVQQNMAAYTGADYRVITAPSGSVFYGIDTASGALIEQNLSTGEKRTVSDQLPVSDTAQAGPRVGDIQFVQLVNRTPEAGDITVMGYGVNVSTGETRQITLEMVANFTRQPMRIIAASGDKLMVQTEETQGTQMMLDTDGTPYTTDTAQPVYAIITLADYFAGTPNLMSCTMLDGVIG